MALIERIRDVHRATRGTYGAPRVQAQRAKTGEHTSRKRVARLMRSAWLSGVRPPHRVRTTVVDRTAPVTPNLLNRNFSAESPNRRIAESPVGGRHHLRPDTGRVALSGRVVGWSMADHLPTEQPLQALSMAIKRRRPKPGTLIKHNDRGC